MSPLQGKKLFSCVSMTDAVSSKSLKLGILCKISLAVIPFYSIVAMAYNAFALVQCVGTGDSSFPNSDVCSMGDPIESCVRFVQVLQSAASSKGCPVVVLGIRTTVVYVAFLVLFHVVPNVIFALYYMWSWRITEAKFVASCRQNGNGRLSDRYNSIAGWLNFPRPCFFYGYLVILVGLLSVEFFVPKAVPVVHTESVIVVFCVAYVNRLVYLEDDQPTQELLKIVRSLLSLLVMFIVLVQLCDNAVSILGLCTISRQSTFASSTDGLFTTEGGGVFSSSLLFADVAYEMCPKIVFASGGNDHLVFYGVQIVRLAVTLLFQPVLFVYFRFFSLSPPWEGREGHYRVVDINNPSSAFLSNDNF